MKNIIILSVLFLFVHYTEAQTYVVPEWATICKNANGDKIALSADFDSDGINDNIVLCHDGNNKKYIIVFVGKIYFVDGNYWYFPWDAKMNTIKFSNGILSISSCFGNGRYCKVLKLKYYDYYKNMRLIGYEEQYYGDATNKGAYFKTIDFLADTYTLDDVTKPITIKYAITLSDIETWFDSLEKVGQ